MSTIPRFTAAIVLAAATSISAIAISSDSAPSRPAIPSTGVALMLPAGCPNSMVWDHPCN